MENDARLVVEVGDGGSETDWDLNGATVDISSRVGVWHSSATSSFRKEGDRGTESSDGTASGECSGSSVSRNTVSVAGSGTGSGANRIRRALPGMDEDLACFWWVSSSAESEEEDEERGLVNMLGEHGSDSGWWRGEPEGEGLRRMD